MFSVPPPPAGIAGGAGAGYNPLIMHNKIWACLLLGLVVFMQHSTPAAVGPTPADAGDAWHSRGVLLSDARLADLKRRVADHTEPTYTAFLKLRASADAQRDRRPTVPREWYVPGFYSDPVGHTKAKDGLQQDANSAYELALMYRMTDNPIYATAAARLINGWATGVQSLSQKDDSMLCFSYHFPAFIFAADLLKNAPEWPTAQRKTFQAFVRDKALPMNTMARRNNWGNWGLVLVLSAAAYLQDHALFQEGTARARDFIDEQIADDGHLPLEVVRNNGVGERGLWYSHFTLMPQTLAFEIARVNGVDLFDYRSPHGHTLRRAFERVAPWAHHPETFPLLQRHGPERSEGHGLCQLLGNTQRPLAERRRHGDAGGEAPADGQHQRARPDLHARRPPRRRIIRGRTPGPRRSRGRRSGGGGRRSRGGH